MLGPHENGVFAHASVRHLHHQHRHHHHHTHSPWPNVFPIPHHQQRGIIPRIVDDIFASMQEAEEYVEFTAKVSFIEIYLEKVRDLLNPGCDNLRVREDSSKGGKGVWIDGVTEEYAGCEVRTEAW